MVSSASVVGEGLRCCKFGDLSLELERDGLGLVRCFLVLLVWDVGSNDGEDGALRRFGDVFVEPVGVGIFDPFNFFRLILTRLSVKPSGSG